MHYYTVFLLRQRGAAQAASMSWKKISSFLRRHCCCFSDCPSIAFPSLSDAEVKSNPKSFYSTMKDSDGRGSKFTSETEIKSETKICKFGNTPKKSKTRKNK